MEFFYTEKINPASQQKLKKLANHLERIPQSFLFSGPEETGKFWLAVNFFGYLNALDPKREQLKLAAEGQHPDFLILDEAMVERIAKETEAQKKFWQIGVEEARKILERFRYAPYQATWQMLVIPDSQRLTGGAANSLLKFIEEPPPQTIVVLLTTKEQQLLPTLRSRLHSLQLGLSDVSEVEIFLEDFLGSQQISFDKGDSDWRETLSLAGGRPLCAARFFLNKSDLEARKLAVERFRVALKGGILEGLTLAEEFSKKDKDAVLRDLDLWVDYLRSFLLKQIKKGTSRQVVARVESLLEELLRVVAKVESSNVSTRFELDNFFVQMQS